MDIILLQTVPECWIFQRTFYTKLIANMEQGVGFLQCKSILTEFVSRSHCAHIDSDGRNSDFLLACEATVSLVTFEVTVVKSKNTVSNARKASVSYYNEHYVQDYRSQASLCTIRLLSNRCTSSTQSIQ